MQTAASLIFNSDLDSDQIEQLCIASVGEGFQVKKGATQKRAYIFADGSGLLVNTSSRPCAVSIYDPEN